MQHGLEYPIQVRFLLKRRRRLRYSILYESNITHQKVTGTFCKNHVLKLSVRIEALTVKKEVEIAYI